VNGALKKGNTGNFDVLYSYFSLSLRAGASFMILELEGIRNGNEFGPVVPRVEGS
jgi:hypothetical protein